MILLGIKADSILKLINIMFSYSSEQKWSLYDTIECTINRTVIMVYVIRIVIRRPSDLRIIITWFGLVEIIRNSVTQRVPHEWFNIIFCSLQQSDFNSWYCPRVKWIDYYNKIDIKKSFKRLNVISRKYYCELCNISMIYFNITTTFYFIIYNIICI